MDEIERFIAKLNDMHNDPNIEPYLGHSSVAITDANACYARGVTDARQVDSEIDTLIAEGDMIGVEAPAYRVRRLTELHQQFLTQLRAGMETDDHV